MNEKQLHIINDLSVDIELDLMTIKYNGGNTGWLTPIYGCKSYNYAINYKWQCPIISNQTLHERAQTDPAWAEDFFCTGTGMSEGDDRDSRLEAYGCVYKGAAEAWNLLGQDDGSCALEGPGQDFCCPNWTCPDDCGSMYGIQYNGCEDCNCGDPQYGCMDSDACNYNSNAQVDDGTCWYPQNCYNCAGGCICGTDNCGTCGGTCSAPCDCGWCGSVDDCNHDCNGTVVDECGVCGGSGPSYTCFDGSLACSSAECPQYDVPQWVRFENANQTCETACMTIGQTCQGDYWMEGPGQPECGSYCDSGWWCENFAIGASQWDWNDEGPYPGFDTSCGPLPTPSCQQPNSSVINYSCKVYVDPDLWGGGFPWYDATLPASCGNLDNCPPQKAGSATIAWSDYPCETDDNDPENCDSYCEFVEPRSTCDADGYQDGHPPLGCGRVYDIQGQIDKWCCCGNNTNHVCSENYRGDTGRIRVYDMFGTTDLSSIPGITMGPDGYIMHKRQHGGTQNSPGSMRR
jgi:hypothetical protein